MDKNNHIDDIFRSKLGEYKPEYVPEHWQMMKAAISSSGKTGSVSTINFTAKLLIVISALIIVSSGVYTYLLTQKYNTLKNKENNIAQVIPNKKNTIIPMENQNISSADKISANDIKNNITPQSNSVKEKNVPQNSNISTYNTHKEEIKVRKTSQKVKSETTVTSTITGKHVTKEPVTTDENVALSDKNNTGKDAGYLNEPLMEGSVPVINILSKNAGSVLNKEETDKNKDVSDKENKIKEDNNYTSVTDDYLVQKQKYDKKHQKELEHKSKKSKIVEALPDCKVSMVNNFVENPAYAGFNQRHTISLSALVHKPLYRPSNDFNVPLEYSMGYDFNFGKRKNCGIGIDYKRFLGAAEGSLAVDLTFAYRINLAKYHNLRLGGSFSYLASDVNKGDLTFPDMIDPRSGFVYNSSEKFPDKTIRNNFDLGFGVWYSWKTFYVGVSAIHLTSPEIGVISKSKIPREYMLSSGYGFDLGKTINVLPSVELKYNEKIINVSPSMLFTYRRWLLFGIEFQNLRNAGIVLGCNLKNNVIINIYTGIPTNKDIIKNFGVIDYAGLSLRFQFGNFR